MIIPDSRIKTCGNEKSSIIYIYNRYIYIYNRHIYIDIYTYIISIYNRWLYIDVYKVIYRWLYLYKTDLYTYIDCVINSVSSFVTSLLIFSKKSEILRYSYSDFYRVTSLTPRSLPEFSLFILTYVYWKKKISVFGYIKQNLFLVFIISHLKDEKWHSTSCPLMQIYF